MNQHLLLVEDDESVRETTTLVLERAGFRVTGVRDGYQALELAAKDCFDLMILDLMLPGLHGLEVCREIRRTSRLPIVMLTALADKADVVVGLELGADDYVTKPFEGRELVARVRAVLRRGRADQITPVIRVAELEIDPAAFTVRRSGVPVDLTATEFRVLLELATHPGQVLTREVLLSRVWGYDFLGESRLVDMAVKRVRDKLCDDPRAPRYIATVRGVGYRFERE
jgi:two-component system response regulator MtrA